MVCINNSFFIVEQSSAVWVYHSLFEDSLFEEYPVVSSLKLETFVYRFLRNISIHLIGANVQVSSFSVV